MFRKEVDFKAFERVRVLAHKRQPIRILSYCVLSNHWHFVAWPEEDGWPRTAGLYAQPARQHRRPP
jgi:putative transposase